LDLGPWTLDLGLGHFDNLAKIFSFGGVTMLFSGDWRQILPVVPKGGKAEILNASFKTSPLWQKVIFYIS
jgi:hypothetical protein